jgi:hypothetical protein
MSKFKLLLLALSVSLVSACGGGSDGCSAGFGGIVGGSGACDKSTTNPSDSAPLAMAGADQSVLVGATVTLDGSFSRDPDGKPLTYLWTLSNKPAGSAATLSSSTAVLPTFVADKTGFYVASLKVNDGGKDSILAYVNIATAEQNAAPVANAGLNQKVKVGDMVTLDGSFSSDANRDSLTFTWKLIAPGTSKATLSSTSAVRPTFTPDIDGNYAAYLTVSDGTLTSNIADVSVEAKVVNSAPTARISTMAPVAMGKTVTLDGSASADPDRDPMTYKWVLISQPPGSSQALSSTNAVKPSLNASTAGNYVASLVVNDGTVNSEHAFITLTVMAPPVAKAVITDGTAPLAGDIPSATELTMDGSASSDPLKASLSYKWTLTAAPLSNLAELVTPNAAKTTFTPIEVGDYVVTLVVSNGTVDSNTHTLLLKVVAAAP